MTQTFDITELGPYWVEYIERMVASDRYANATEVVSEALRMLEEKQQAQKQSFKELLFNGPDLSELDLERNKEE